MQFRTLIALAAALSISTSVHAHDYKVGNLRIEHPYARATVPNQSSGSVYLTIENTGTRTDKLISVSSPIARTTQIHTMSMDGNVMRMREVSSVELKPSTKLTMKPGSGYHLMLTNLKQPLKVGDKFSLTLNFEKSGMTKISVWIEDTNQKAATAPTAHQHN